jgi:hypothetical protein
MIEQNKANEFNITMFFEIINGHFQGDLRCFMYWIAIDACADGWEDMLFLFLVEASLRLSR